MAKKGKADTPTNNIEDRLLEQFGDGVIVNGSYVVEQPLTIVPVSPQIDIMLNGGVPFGSFIIPTGKPKVGKTSLSIDLAATAVNIPTKFDNPRHIYYFKVEGRLQPRDLLGIHHLKEHVDSKITIIQSRRGKILNAEDFLDIAEQLINEKPGCIFIMDSMSQLCSSSRRQKDWHDGKTFRDDTPVLLSNFCKRLCQVIPINESIFIGITHRIANTGIGFSPWAEASGNKVQYQVDVKLHATHNQIWKNKPSDETKVGIEVFWECYASPLQNGESVEKCSSKFRFGWGIDKHTELLNVAADLRLIKKSGAWYELQDDNNTTTKLQGLPAARQFLLENPKSTTKLYTQFREMMGLPTIPEEYLELCL